MLRGRRSSGSGKGLNRHEAIDQLQDGNPRAAAYSARSTSAGSVLPASRAGVRLASTVPTWCDLCQGKVDPLGLHVHVRMAARGSTRDAWSAGSQLATPPTSANVPPTARKTNGLPTSTP